MKFQSTLRRTERRYRLKHHNAERHFNPRSGERSDTTLVYTTNDTLISIHAPANGATVQVRHYRHLPTDFNPRSGERSDNNCANNSHLGNKISIHAPANGATVFFDASYLSPLYFNPRSGERSDTVCFLIVPLSSDFNPRSGERSDAHSRLRIHHLHNFNPRSGERSDLCPMAVLSFHCKISIHAPANGAT